MIDTNNAFEVECHKFVSDASTLGLPPGRWPRTIETRLGNGQPLVLQSHDANQAKYRQALGCITLTVFND